MHSYSKIGHCHHLVAIMALMASVSSSSLAQSNPTPAAPAQPETNVWQGTLQANVPLRLELQWQGSGDKTTGVLTSLDQAAAKFAVDSIRVTDDQLVFEVTQLRVRYEGKFNEQRTEIVGTFTQSGRELPLKFVPAGAKARQQLREAWIGTLEAGGVQLKIQFRVFESDGGKTTAVMDSLDEKQGGIPAQATFNDQGATFDVPVIRAKFEGAWNQDKSQLDGHWQQSGQKFPMQMTKSAPEKLSSQPRSDRPQTPLPPFPYQSRRVTFDNTADSITLAGTLTVPPGPGPFPAAVLINGSGAHDRNVDLFGHQLFLVVADYLTRKGIVVLRYDERGVGESQGDYSTATSVELARDAAAAADYLHSIPQVQRAQLGLIGHSEGGYLAPMVASQRDDIGWLVLLAGPGVNGREVLLNQAQLIAEAASAPAEQVALSLQLNRALYAHIDTTTPQAELRQKLKQVLADELAKLSPEQRQLLPDTPKLEASLEGLLSPWYRYFMLHEPREALRQIQCPVLVLNGDKDLQIDPRLNVPAIEDALRQAGNSRVEVHILKGYNHLFQSCTTGLPTEYAQLEETFSPTVLELMTQWILGHSP